MSNAPFNNYAIMDLSGNQQPYLNSTAEFGYFSGTSVGTMPTGYWYSLPSVLNTNNGLANVDASGLNILNAGIYKINLSVFPTSIQDGSCNISFCFGSKYLFDFSTNLVVNAFGGQQSTGMFTYNQLYNPSIPGIISWIANGYSSGNSTGSNFVKNSSTNELGYNYNTAGNTSQIDSGICTTEITFVVDSSATIFFNVSTNSNTGATFGNCCFTLQLISSNYYPPQPFVWRQTTAPSFKTQWKSIASSSTGQYLAAALYQGNITNAGIYTSNNYGSSWTPQRNGLPESYGIPKWNSIASDSTGRYLAAVSSDTNVGVYVSDSSGATWIQTTLIVTSFGHIASDSTGKYLVIALNNSYIYTNADYGSGNWNKINNTDGLAWNGIASDSTGQYLAAVIFGGGIYTSDSSGNSWSSNNNAPTGELWNSIASDSTGKYLAAVVNGGGIYTSNNYGSGNSWSITSAPILAWNSITSDSTGKYLAAVYSSGTTAGIYTSNNYGSSWNLQTSGLPSSAGWQSITSSSDGTKLAAVTNNDGIYTSTYS